MPAVVAREFREVPLHLIDEPVLPSRSQMDEEQLDELTASIRAIGLQQPMVIAFTGERYRVVAGHRRRLACGRAGLVAAPCIVYADDAPELLAAQFAENYHREELNAADEAIWFSELLEHYCGGDVDVLAARLHLKRGYVENRLLLFQGDDRVFDALRADHIKIGVAHQLNRCTNEGHRRYLLDAAMRGGATVAVVSGWIAEWQQQQRLVGELPPAVVTNTPPGAVPETNYFTCICCGGTNDVHLMQPINVHTHCKLAILDKMIAAYRGDV